MKRLNGGSLFYALAISVIAGMMMAGVVAAGFYHRMLLRKNAVSLEVARNAQSGIILSCSVEAGAEEMDVDLFGRGQDSVHITRRAWGVYDIRIARAHTGIHSCERIALTGAIQDKNPFALWLADMDRPLSVTGATLLKGTCYLPQQGIERAYIEGRSFSGRELVQGGIRNSSRFIPQYDQQRLGVLKALINGIGAGDSIISWSEIAGEAEFSRSFSGNGVRIHSEFPVLLSQVKLNGQIVISSAVSITAESSAELENVILVAPRIVIKEKTKGCFQAFARDSVIIGEDVQLNYPSVLGIVAAPGACDKPGIAISGPASIHGEVFLITDVNNQQGGNILVDKETCVEGSVYSTTSIDLKGKIYGSLTCQKITLHTNSAVYDNYLMDAEIDRSKLHPAWLGSFLFHQSRDANVIQWLH